MKMKTSWMKHDARQRRDTTIALVVLILFMFCVLLGGLMVPDAPGIHKPRDGPGLYKDRIANGPLHGEIAPLMHLDME